MMISEGKGIHADSIAISAATPKYPVLEITPIMILASTAIIFSVIRRVYSLNGIASSAEMSVWATSEFLRILGKRIAWQTHALIHTGNFHAYALCLRRNKVNGREPKTAY